MNIKILNSYFVSEISQVNVTKADGLKFHTYIPVHSFESAKY